MSRLVKDMITKELETRFRACDSALWIEMIGIDGITTNNFRRELRDKNMRLEVVKNSLFRRAVGDGPLKALAEAVSGPAAILTGGDSLIDVAKLVDEWLPKAKGLKLRGAVLEGEWIGESQVASLSKMEGRADLLAKIALIVLSPAKNLAGAINAPGANVAGAIKALVEKLEEGEEVVAQAGE